MKFDDYKLLTKEIMKSINRTNEVYVGFLAIQNITLLKNEINDLLERNNSTLEVKYNLENATLEISNKNIFNLQDLRLILKTSEYYLDRYLDVLSTKDKTEHRDLVEKIKYFLEQKYLEKGKKS